MGEVDTNLDPEVPAKSPLWVALAKGTAIGALAAIAAVSVVRIVDNEGSDSSPAANESRTTTPTSESSAGSLDSDEREFCEAVEEWARAFDEREDESKTLAYRDDASQRVIDGFTKVPRAAPPALWSEMSTARSIDPDTVIASQKRELDAALSDIDRFVRNECDLLFSFEDVNLYDV